MDHPIISKRGSGGGGHGGGGHGGGEGGHGGDEGGHGDSGEPGEPGGGHGEPEIGDGPLDSGPEAPPPNDPAEVAADTVTQITNALLPPQSRQNTTPANPNPVHIDTTGFQEPLPIPPAPANPPRGPLPLRPQGPGPAVTPASNDRFDAFFQAVPGYQQLDSQYDQAQASYSVAYRNNPIDEETLVPLVQTLATTSQQTPPLPADISLAMPQQQDNWAQLIQIWSQTLQEDEDELNTEQQPAGPPGGSYLGDPGSYGGYDPNAVLAQYGFPPTTNSGFNPTYDSSNVLPPNRAAVLNLRQKPAAPLRQTPGGLRGGVVRAPVANPNPNPRPTGPTPRGGARRGGAVNPTQRATAPSPGVLKASAGVGKK